MRVGLILLVSIFLCGTGVMAFDSANPYWFALKPKLEKYLKANIDANLYEYKILGPVTEMKKFLGNRPDAEVKFEKLNLASANDRKSIVAAVYNSDGSLNDSIIINLEVQKYKEVMMLKHPVKAGDAITEADVYKKKILASTLDEKLYYTGDLKQKYASSNLVMDTALKTNMLRHEKLIKTGDNIKVNSGSQFIQLGFVCKAAGNADLGETISLICPDIEKKNLKGIVTGSGTAKLL